MNLYETILMMVFVGVLSAYIVDKVLLSNDKEPHHD